METPSAKRKFGAEQESMARMEGSKRVSDGEQKKAIFFMTQREQITTKDATEKEWVHPYELRFYLHQDRRKGLWCVIDRASDLPVTKQYMTKRGAYGQLLREWKRTSGTSFEVGTE